MARSKLTPKPVAKPLKPKFDREAAQPIGLMTIDDGRAIDYLKAAHVVYDERIPLRFLDRKGYGTDVEPCLGFRSKRRAPHQAMQAAERAGCRMVRFFQAVAIASIAYQRGLIRTGQSYLMIGEKIQVGSEDFFLRISLREGLLYFDLFPVAEFVDYDDLIAIAARSANL